MSILRKAATEFLKDENRREKRPRFSSEERQNLREQLHLLACSGEDLVSAAARGQALVKVSGYESDLEDQAVNVIADILHALRHSGIDPLYALAHARAEYMRDLGEEVEPDTWPVPGEELEGGIEATSEGENDGA